MVEFGADQVNRDGVENEKENEERERAEAQCDGDWLEFLISDF